MTDASWVNAHNGGRQVGLLHASPNPPEPLTATGAGYRAACGKRVRHVTRVAWTPVGPTRRCPDCLAATR